MTIQALQVGIGIPHGSGSDCTHAYIWLMTFDLRLNSDTDPQDDGCRLLSRLLRLLQTSDAAAADQD